MAANEKKQQIQTVLPATSPAAPAAQESETASAAVATQMRSAIEARYILAMRNPRDLDSVRIKLLRECQRPGFAEVARYKKPIGKGVEGPSIRFAEAAIRCMKNIDTSTMTVYDDREKRIVKVGVCDIEENVIYSQDVTITKTVERHRTQKGDTVLGTRTNSRGETLYLIEATDDDILNKQNALISKAIRTLGLRLIPGDIVEESMDAVVDTQKKADAVDPDAAKKKLFDAFASIGVQVADIKEWLGHSGENLGAKELADLRGIYSAIKDGEATWREVMDSAGKGKKENPTFAEDERHGDSGAAPATAQRPATQPSTGQAAPASPTPAPATTVNEMSAAPAPQDEPPPPEPQGQAASLQSPNTENCKAAVLARFKGVENELMTFLTSKKLVPEQATIHGIAPGQWVYLNVNIEKIFKGVNALIDKRNDGKDGAPNV